MAVFGLTTQATQTRPAEERAAFANELEAVLEKAGSLPCLIGWDANACVATLADQVTGDLQCGEADQSGIDLVNLLAAHGCWLPSTFSTCHGGARETWTHPGGKRSRVDFPVVGQHFNARNIRTWAAVEINTLNCNDDHDAVGMHVTRLQPCRGRCSPLLDRRKQFDPRKLREPEVIQKVF